MDGVCERIGEGGFVLVIVEIWNEMLILLLIMIMVQGIRHDRLCGNVEKDAVRQSYDIIVFDLIVLLYNICDILTLLLTGLASPEAERSMQISAFVYHIAAEIHSLFILHLFITKIAGKLQGTAPRRMTRAILVLHIPLVVLLLTAPFTGYLYRIRDHQLYLRTWGYSIWSSVTILTMLYLGVMLIINWKSIEAVHRRSMAAAVFMPLFGEVVSYATGLRLTNSLAYLTVVIIFLLYIQYKSQIAVQSINALSQTQILLAESRFSLERSKNETLMAQIQPHFINNSLMALAARCADYPDIYDSIMNFSRYLHSHFDALGETKPIPFEQEMTNIEAYLDLVRENYQERLRVEYEIDCDDFNVPALSVQPLVENAVQHSISMYEQGGTLTISARREQGQVIIEVTDEGAGKNSITPQQRKRKGIGVENVRARLASMSDGRLEIFQRENGTTARITITKCEEAVNDDDTFDRRPADDHGADVPDAHED